VVTPSDKSHSGRPGTKRACDSHASVSHLIDLCGRWPYIFQGVSRDQLQADRCSGCDRRLGSPPPPGGCAELRQWHHDLHSGTDDDPCALPAWYPRSARRRGGADRPGSSRSRCYGIVGRRHLTGLGAALAQQEQSSLADGRDPGSRAPRSPERGSHRIVVEPSRPHEPLPPARGGIRPGRAAPSPAPRSRGAAAYGRLPTADAGRELPRGASDSPARSLCVARMLETRMPRTDGAQAPRADCARDQRATSTRPRSLLGRILVVTATRVSRSGAPWHSASASMHTSIVQLFPDDVGQHDDP
jgi:hypothetical protein